MIAAIPLPSKTLRPECLLIADIIGASSVHKISRVDSVGEGARDMGQQRKDTCEKEPLLRLSDRREGQWTKLHLLEMDERFQTALRRELVKPGRRPAAAPGRDEPNRSNQ